MTDLENQLLRKTEQLKEAIKLRDKAIDILQITNMTAYRMEKANARLMSEMGHIKKENKLLNKKVIEQETMINEMKCCKNCLYENDDEELVEQMKTNSDFCFECKKHNRKNWRLYK